MHGRLQLKSTWASRPSDNGEHETIGDFEGELIIPKPWSCVALFSVEDEPKSADVPFGPACFFVLRFVGPDRIHLVQLGDCEYFHGQRAYPGGGYWKVRERLTCERNEYGVFESEQCARAARTEAEMELREVYEKLLSKLDSGPREALVASQDAWERYRAATLRLIYAIEGDGSAGRMIVENDKEQALRARAEELRRWLSE